MALKLPFGIDNFPRPITEAIGNVSSVVEGGAKTVSDLMGSKNGKQNFDSAKALQPVASIINEASLALGDETRTILSSTISDGLKFALTAKVASAIGSEFFFMLAGGAASNISLEALTGFAAIGGLAGVGVAAAITGGVTVAKTLNGKRLEEEKKKLYQAAIQKQSAIIRELEKEKRLLQEESGKDKARIDYLTALNISLQKVIVSLREDLAIASA